MITSKTQTTMPQAVRTALGLKPGHEVAYSIHQGRGVLTKAATATIEDPLAVFGDAQAMRLLIKFGTSSSSHPAGQTRLTRRQAVMALYGQCGAELPLSAIDLDMAKRPVPLTLSATLAD
jgi:antitoxin PrlF